MSTALVFRKNRFNTDDMDEGGMVPVSDEACGEIVCGLASESVRSPSEKVTAGTAALLIMLVGEVPEVAPRTLGAGVKVAGACPPLPLGGNRPEADGRQALLVLPRRRACFSMRARRRMAEV